MMIQFVQATKVDIDRILTYMEAFYAIDAYPFNKEQARFNLSQFLADQALGCLFMVQEHENPIGYLVLSYGFSFEYGGRDAFIDEFYLVEAARGRGVGGQVMEMLEKEASALGVKAIHLEVESHNKKGNRIYKKAGYKANDRTLMTKRIG